MANDDAVGDLAERPDGQLVRDIVRDPGAIALAGKGVAVLPAPVGAAQLEVAEAVGRVVVDDAAAPRGRNAEQRPDAVRDLEPIAHREVARP